MKTFFRKLHYGKKAGLCLLLSPFSLVYGFVVKLRNFLYDTNIIKSVKLPAFVISVGNLTTGGTGKTPVTCAIANHMTGQGKRVAVISRGYGGKLSNKNTNIISDGEKIYYNAQLAGDEPYWIAKNAPGTVVLTGKNRVASGKLAIAKFNAEVLVLDDGFQHRKLFRDLDIVLINSKNSFGNGCLLPAGPLREPENGLSRANRVVVVKKDDTDNYTAHFKCELKPEKIDYTGKAVAFTGIARPEHFFEALERQNIGVVLKKTYPDHYLYRENDLKALVTEAKKLGAGAVITTEKDIVKIEPFIKAFSGQIPFYTLKLRVELDVERLISENSRNPL